MKWKTKNRLYRLFHPSFWVEIGKTDYGYDAQLCQKMRENDIVVDLEEEEENQFYAVIGDIRIWIRNYPYGFGHPMMNHGCLPAPLTRVELKHKLNVIRRLGKV